MYADVKKKRAMRYLAAFMVEHLMERNSCQRDEALTILMTTTVYEALMDPETELYLESKESLQDILDAELAGNPYRLLVV